MSIEDKWLDTYYAEVGREIGVASSQLHQTTNWSIGITMAAVSAIALSKGPYPQPWTMAAVVVAFILVLRFFVRSCLAYVNLDKWNKVHRAITEYRLGLSSDQREACLSRIEQAISAYHIQWHSPRPIGKLLWSNLKLGYLHLFLILLALLGVGIITAPCDAVNWILLAAWAVCVVYEVILFPRKTYFKYVKIPEAAEGKNEGDS